jgi:hypothetical protein
MAVVKIIEILAESNESWEAAAQEAVTEAAKTVRNIQTIFINSLQGIVKDDKIVNYRVDAKISFVVKE